MPKIIADFERISLARTALQQLKDLGHRNAHYDMLDNFRSEYAEEIFAGVRKHSSSQSAIVLRSKDYFLKSGKASLLSAHPHVSGMGSDGDSLDTGIRLVVQVNSEKAGEIKKLLEELGGSVI